MLDLVGSGKPEYVEQLWREIGTVLAEHGDQWDKRSLS